MANGLMIRIIRLNAYLFFLGIIESMKINRKTFIIGGLLGLIVGGILFEISKNRNITYLNFPLVVADVFHSMIFGCEAMLNGAGKVEVIFACSPIKVMIGKWFSLMVYSLIWIIIGVLFVSVFKFIWSRIRNTH